MKNKIGLDKKDIVVGKNVYYYTWKDNYTNSEPIKTEIVSGVYNVSNQLTCKVKDIVGVVAISHLSFNYYPEKNLSNSQIKAKDKYQKYLSSETTLSFIDYIRYVYPFYYK